MKQVYICGNVPSSYITCQLSPIDLFIPDFNLFLYKM